jgi:hypothetical protein
VLVSNNIILMDQNGLQSSVTLSPMTFAELGVQERKDLEEWIKHNPAILGTKLLLIDSEYDGFDKSEKRLDLLALDDKGKLVIIELKRDTTGSHADLQAIRYAAFCSTMTFDNVVSLYGQFAKKSDSEEARRYIQEFIGKPDFSKLDNQPRIILAAGNFDAEVTSCVLWLRSFGVDISCVEITPYRMPDSRIVLVPRVIIPLPEAADYIVKAEKKEAEQGRQTEFTEEDLLKMAVTRGIRPLVDICRKLGATWNEGASYAYGGSFLYSLTTDKGWRSLFGINVSGKRKNTPVGNLDIWIPIKNVAEVTNQDPSVVRSAIDSEKFQVLAQEKIDLVIRLNKAGEAEALISRLIALAAPQSTS